MEMQLREFIDYHVPALEKNQPRHNLILGILGRVSGEASQDLRLWTLGGPGQCAIQSPGRNIVLGELDEAQCRSLADETRALEYPGVVGPDSTGKWFVTRARDHGLDFVDPIPQRIYALSETPRYPAAPGHARQVGSEDASLFADWMLAFVREAVPHDPIPSRDELETRAAEGRHVFWIVDGAPVSMAGIARRTRNCAVVAPVYTPPEKRARGYAGSATAAVVERAYAEGKSTVCLYADARNASSNRCYTNIGFEPVSESRLYLRRQSHRSEKQSNDR
jgi:RimJ/RimL family protein N-acetyltransferase